MKPPLKKETTKSKLEAISFWKPQFWKGRPLPINIITLLIIITSIVAIYQTINELLTQPFAFLTLIYSFIALSQLIAATGFWNMKKWGLFLYGGVFLFNISLHLVFKQFNWQNIIAPALVLLVTTPYYKGMN